ncbi:ABC transporter ATP-binding protein [Allorhodopirellula solitaria]|uniref:Putative multidrug export ATP-binding/permease protein n=1 Tax=Allorhodopirellula solitaria TaxID=2527987 RepID=A0A5C5XVE3_9BACT|nr:ABC transporter ATP-binding protein [Allorhodopirellula solitaria]TWT65965.1 putative multidrug export ATP-binding/permease protein [Allorhodopirellula solitaria]
MAVSPSRRRFDDYRATVQERHRQGGAGSASSTHAPHHGHSDVDGSRAARSQKKIGDRTRSFFELFSAFWQLIQGHRGPIIAALGLLSVGIAIRLIPPLGTKLAIDSVLTVPARPLPEWLVAVPGVTSILGDPAVSPMRTLVAIALVVTVLTAVGTMINLLGRWLATKSVNKAQVSIRRRVFEHSMRLPLHHVYAMKSGGVASLIREDAGGVADLIFSMLYNPWRAIVQFCGSLVILMFVDWKLMVGGLILLPVVWVTHRTYINRIRPLFRDVRKQRQRIDSGATETFGGIRVVRTFSRSRTESSRYVREGDFLVRQQLFTWWWMRIIETIWEVVIPLASTGLLLYGGYQIIHGQLTLGDLMMFLVYLTMLLDPLATLAGSAVTFQNNLAGLDRILDVLEVDEELPSREGAARLSSQTQGGAISIRGVSFHYPASETPVLQDVSIEIAAGQTVALVGRSGAGKTTLTNLIARFYDPTAGEIHYNGVDLRDIELSSYRALLGIVEQDVFLFDGTIHENIAYARPKANRPDVIAAASAAAADEFILKMELGYDTVIGERGVKLSGGQRQRLAIARAILADPQILILDEATSNLDSQSERLIQSSLSDLLQDRTAVVIAHRLSTIAGADLIVVLEDGRVLETGTHAELLARGGHYQDMVNLQMNQSTSDASPPTVN